MNYDKIKPAKTYEEQLDILESRGLIIPDKSRAIAILRQVSYYRLSPYSLGLRNEDDTFHDDISIEQLFNIYIFDEQLRHLLFNIIEPIEIRLRSEVSYFLAVEYGNVAHLNFNIVQDKKEHLNFLSTYYESIYTGYDQACTNHNINKYGELPIWAVVETLTFGTMSRFYGNLNIEIQNKISKLFNTDTSRLKG